MRATTVLTRVAALSGSPLRGRARRGDLTGNKILAGVVPRQEDTGAARDLVWGKHPAPRRSLPRYHRPMPFEPIATPDAPRAIGPYSQAIAARGGRWLFCSGQIPIDLRTGE